MRAQEIRDAAWFSEHWIEDTLHSAPAQFDSAFDRWRELYRSTTALRNSARLRMDDPHATKKEREEAERRETEARREIQLLLNQTNRQEESDFYPYRYLAGEGFLPGYNFPRLPVRASVTVGNNARLIDRPRFLGLTEFGPQNQVYHEGRKHRIYASVLPPSGIEGRLTRARLCRVCGYAHDAARADVELCEHCGTRLDGDTSDFPQRLLEQPMMRARPSQRISSEEEERARSGYRVTTHFNLAGGRSRSAFVQSESGEHLLKASYAPAASLWRINHGWRRGDHTGFTIDPQTGQWGSLSDGEELEGRVSSMSYHSRPCRSWPTFYTIGSRLELLSEHLLEYGLRCRIRLWPRPLASLALRLSPRPTPSSASLSGAPGPGRTAASTDSASAFSSPPMRSCEPVSAAGRRCRQR